MSKLKVIYMGTPEFSVPSLEALVKHDKIEVEYVISMPDRPSGRGYQLKSPEVIDCAKKHNLKFFQTDNINKETDFLSELKLLNIDAIIVLAFAQFLGPQILNLPKLGCFNIHTSLLPKYRGAAPIQYAIRNGDKVTGVSIQKMVKKMDAGDICFSRDFEINEDETSGELFDRLKSEAAIALNQFIEVLADGNVEYHPQNESLASFAPTIKKSDGQLDFKNSSSTQVINTIRAFTPWPGTFCHLNDKRMKVLKVEKVSSNLEAGQCKVIDKALLVGCTEGSVRLIEVQLDGKKKCTDTELLNGLRDTKFNIN